MKKILKKLLPAIDILLVPVVYIAALLFRKLRSKGVHRLPRCKNVLLSVGVFPIMDHYYDPQFSFKELHPDFSDDRNLVGVDLNVTGQLAMLARLTYAAELGDKAGLEASAEQYHHENEWFTWGDAEYWYQVIRALKPKRIIEIGSGHSTLMAIKAIQSNMAEVSSYTCQHVCIEPYEMPWLEKTGVEVLRKKVELVELEYFKQLEEGDILFIDSSHIIRPFGDVLYEYLEILPSLNKGVVVHIHDIFTPKNYLQSWVEHEVRLWNEQYLLEAFLTHNSDWEVVGALNYLHHHHAEKFRTVAPFTTSQYEPSSFYIRKTT